MGLRRISKQASTYKTDVYLSELLPGNTSNDPVLVWCWASVCEAGPTPNQHWLNVSCSQGWWDPCFPDEAVISRQITRCIDQMLAQFRHNAGTSSTTLAQHQTSSGSLHRVFRAICAFLLYCYRAAGVPTQQTNQ